MKQIQVDIKNALDLIHGKVLEPYEFKKYSSPFLFANENQEGINEIVDYKDKDVCTIAASGDQYLGASYYGAKRVDIFDINRLTYFITCLKIAAVRILDYKEFIDFFMPMDEAGKIKDSFWNLATFKHFARRCSIFLG